MAHVVTILDNATIYAALAPADYVPADLTAEAIVHDSQVRRLSRGDVAFGAYGDPSEEETDSIDESRAREIALEDPSLVYVVVDGERFACVFAD